MKADYFQNTIYHEFDELYDLGKEQFIIKQTDCAAKHQLKIKKWPLYKKNHKNVIENDKQMLCALFFILI